MSKRTPKTEQERIAAGYKRFSFILPDGLEFVVITNNLSNAQSSLKHAIRRHRRDEPVRQQIANQTRAVLQQRRLERLQRERKEMVRRGLVPLDEMTFWDL